MNNTPEKVKSMRCFGEFVFHTRDYSGILGLSIGDFKIKKGRDDNSIIPLTEVSPLPLNDPGGI